jgi:energy-coupling factor transporter ATP-binding protein EcfA2
MDEKDYKNTEEFEKQDNGNEIIEAILKLVLMITFLPIALAYFSASKFATRSFIWRIFDIRKKAWGVAILLLPINLILIKWFVNFLSMKMWLIAGITLIITWGSLLPISIIIIDFRLRNILNQFSKGLVDPYEAVGIRKARTNYAFTKAFKIFKNNDYQMPLLTADNKSILGIGAHPEDLRSRRERKNYPDTHADTELLRGNYFPLELKENEGSHHLVIGATGSGKSHLLSRMALCGLIQNYRVVIFDFKGSNEKHLFKSICDFVPNRKLKTMMYPGDAINLFTGSREEVADRLISFLPSATQGDGDFYRSRMIKAINAVVIRTSYDPPQSIDELLNRVREGLTFAEDPLDIAMFKQKDKGIAVGESIAESIASRFEPLRRTGGHSISGGFKWSDYWDMAVFSFRSTSENEVRLGGAILSSLDDWLTSSDRYIDPRPILLIVDEGGVLQRFANTPSLLNLVSRARSAKCGVVISSQTIESFGDEGESLLGAGPTRWLGKSPSPEDLVKAAGTKDVIEASVQEERENWNGKKTARVQKSYVVDPDLIRSLPQFCWSVSNGNSHLLVYVPPVDFQPK